MQRIHRGFTGSLALAGLLGLIAVACADELPPIALPAPRMTGGKPLLDALKERQSIREFSPAPLPLQVLADLLWAADGINRPAIAHRTAPSAMNSQELDIYVALPACTYVYDAQDNRLVPVAAGDLRARTSSQQTIQAAPVALILVADLARLAKAKPADKERYANMDAGYVSQNIYLFCAAAGLATVVHDLDRQALRAALRLKPEQMIVIAQAVGYPQAAAAKKSSPPP